MFWARPRLADQNGEGGDLVCGCLRRSSAQTPTIDGLFAQVFAQDFCPHWFLGNSSLNSNQFGYFVSGEVGTTVFDHVGFGQRI